MPRPLFLELLWRRTGKRQQVAALQRCRCICVRALKLGLASTEWLEFGVIETGE